jgi:hypothetical protein
MNVFQTFYPAQCFMLPSTKAVTESPMGADLPQGLGLGIKDGPIVKTP